MLTWMATNLHLLSVFRMFLRFPPSIKGHLLLHQLNSIAGAVDYLKDSKPGKHF